MDRATTSRCLALSAALSLVPLAAHAAPAAVERRAEAFLASVAPGLGIEGARPVRYEPVFVYGVNGPAYFEAALAHADGAERGWILVGFVDGELPIAAFSHTGTPPTKSLKSKAGKNGRVFRFGPGFYSLDDEGGRPVATLGTMPAVLPSVDETRGGRGDGDEIDAGPAPVAAGAADVVRDYDDLKGRFAARYFNQRRKAQAATQEKSLGGGGNAGGDYGYGGYYSAGAPGAYSYWWAQRYWDVPYYTQIPAWENYNQKPCWSGCQNNAWLNVFGWWDRGGKAGLIPQSLGGEGVPENRWSSWGSLDAVDPAQMMLATLSNTYCNSGGGWTLWSDAWRGTNYPPAKGYGRSYWYRWCNIPGCSNELRDIPFHAIATLGEPLHVGASSHFWVAYGLARVGTDANTTWVYTYPGWNTDDRDNVWLWWGDLTTATQVSVY